MGSREAPHDGNTQSFAGISSNCLQSPYIPPTMSNSLEDRISAAASRNTALLSTLASTDYAPTAVKHQLALIADLESNLASLDRRIASLSSKREAELKDHNKYKDSFFRKRAHTVFGKKEKFQTTAAKEEREYFDALRDETLAKSQGDELRDQIAQAKRVLSEELEPAVRTHEGAQKELDQLYDSLFDGPTPSFPEEDNLERGATETLHAYNGVRDRLLHEDTARQALAQASLAMNDALRNIGDALGASTWDTWGGGTWSDMMERDSLARTQGCVSKVHMLVDQAMRSSVEVQPLREMRIDQGHFLSDVVFDNLFTDMAQHERIEQSRAEIQSGRSTWTRSSRHPRDVWRASRLKSTERDRTWSGQGNSCKSAGRGV